MRVFLDTNVLVSAVAARGLCADVLREIFISHQLVISAPLISELKRILFTKMGVPREIISELVEVLTQDCLLSENTELINIDTNDRDDVLILSTALNGTAEIFVTGDKELLELEKIQSMRIITPREFWETLKTSPPDEK